MALHVIAGTGPVGLATAAELVSRGEQVVMVSRSGKSRYQNLVTEEVNRNVQHKSVDITDSDALTKAARGAVALYNCASPNYTNWPTDWPPMANALLTAAQHTGAVLATASNLYQYGPNSGVMSESTPANAIDIKGKVRQQMWLDALEAHRAGKVRITEVRASDYVGPGAIETAYGGERSIKPILAGKPVRPLGNPDTPHSWTFLPDFAAMLVTAATDDRAWGKYWHAPSPDPKSMRELVELFARTAQLPTPKIAPVPSWMLTAMAAVNPMMRELKGTSYQFTAPFILDSSYATATFGIQPTDWSTIAAETIGFWTKQVLSAAPSKD